MGRGRRREGGPEDGSGGGGGGPGEEGVWLVPGQDLAGVEEGVEVQVGPKTTCLRERNVKTVNDRATLHYLRRKGACRVDNTNTNLITNL